MDKRLPVMLLCLVALVLSALSLQRLMQGKAAESIGLFIATTAVLHAAALVYLIYRMRNKRE